MLLKGEVGGHALNSHGNYIVDHRKLWKNHGIVNLNFCGNPATMFCTPLALPAGGKFCPLLIIFANNLDTDKDQPFCHSLPSCYKTFFILNSAEHEISTAHKN